MRKYDLPPQIGDRTLLVGFSMGAHVVGEAARFYTRKTGKMIQNCHGIDPAGPFYDECPNDIRLSATDCRTVQVVHSDAQRVFRIPGSTGYGTHQKSGKCDYWSVTIYDF